MANILAVDTSTHACSVALAMSGAITEDFRLIPQSHTQSLLPMIDQLLGGAGISLTNLDVIALTTGPGSFTGLRIGLGIVQGLAFGVDLPVIGESSLRVMAASARRLLTPTQNILVPCFDARMQEVYWACYHNDETLIDSKSPALIADKVSEPEKMVDELDLIKTPILGIGDGWHSVTAKSSSIERVADFYPHAYDLALLAQTAYAAGRLSTAMDIQPTYIRNEVRWQKRQKIRN